MEPEVDRLICCSISSNACVVSDHSEGAEPHLWALGLDWKATSIHKQPNVSSMDRWMQYLQCLSYLQPLVCLNITEVLKLLRLCGSIGINNSPKSAVCMKGKAGMVERQDKTFDKMLFVQPTTGRFKSNPLQLAAHLKQNNQKCLQIMETTQRAGSCLPFDQSMR